MSPRHTRQDRGEARQQAILRAAAEILAGDRMSAVTYRAVAARAGVSAGAIRYYFASREDLLSSAVAEVEGRRHAAALVVVGAGPVSGRDEVIDRLVRANLGDDLDDGALRATIGWLVDAPRESPRLAGELRAHYEAIRSDVAATLVGCGLDPGLAGPAVHVMDGALLAGVTLGRSDLAAHVGAAVGELLDGRV